MLNSVADITNVFKNDEGFQCGTDLNNQISMPIPN